ncbi:MAG: NAD(+)/NADH kinase [Chloroflexi bacterium SZAS-1]|jgi:NAD+ kinase|nr:NAD(+)/NADH kinase [Chloroflexi bacterium SZAS-1]HNP85095.1 NAD(+)/NADH kinase [Kouleothrix sp.]
MQRIGVLYNPFSDASTRISLELAEWLSARGINTWRGVSHEGREDPHRVEGLELLIALGGDGTVLRAARLAIPYGIPVLPVALGRLSFMAELQPEELINGLEYLLAGNGWHDERTLIEATIRHDGHSGQNETVLALNEILVARGEINRVVSIDVEIYNAPLTTYHADGIIAATATGSTAYALAAGGPLIDPRSHALVLVPIAAHLTNIPSLVLHEDAVIRLRLRSRHAAAFSADGRTSMPLHEGDVVEIRRAQQTCLFARVHPPSTFYARLTQRLRRNE